MSNTKHRLDLLGKHMRTWLDMPGVSLTSMAMEIVDRFSAIGLDHGLQIEDIFFMRTDDVCTDADTNRQKIFRWLGWLDNGQKRSPARLFFVEQAIVAAMPEDIRIDYLTEVYIDSGVSFYAGTQGNTVDLDTGLVSLMKETSEAQIALIKLAKDPAMKGEALRELKEALAAHENLLTTLQEMGGGKR